MKNSSIWLFLKNYWLTIIWTIIIVYVCSLPSSDIPKTKLFIIPHFDKIFHFGVYFVLAIFMLLEIRNNKPNARKYWIVGIFTFILGFLIELEQHYIISGRSGNYADLIADTLGLILGMILFWIFEKKGKKLFM